MIEQRIGSGYKTRGIIKIAKRRRRRGVDGGREWGKTFALLM
jgi:hypothetical protein